MEAKKPIVIALMGPTASGKTNLAISIAKALRLKIHNVDSRQIYVDMNVGTAKPTTEEQKEVHHNLIDLCLPSNPITLHDFQSIAITSMESDFKKQKIVFLVGGSGLYLQALIGGLKPPAVPPQKFLRNQLLKIDKIERHQLLSTCDPIAANKIHPEDSRRIVRALEVIYATGKSFSQQQNVAPPPWQILELGLNPQNLNARILERTQQMYRKGLIEETDNLIVKYGENLQLLKTIGYQEARSLINGKLNYEEAIEITTQRTSQFAKRQRTWFKNKHNPKWLNDQNPLADALTSIYEVLG